MTVPIDAARARRRPSSRSYPELASPDTYVQTQDGDVLFGRLDFQADARAPVHAARATSPTTTGVNGTSSATTRTESYNGIEGLDTEAWVAS